ncbi:hypothetical protein B2G86_00615 [Mammaliicoccus fleurettii]|nr:hypothetical protein B2G86_00615 [Mammaliicoccus fleurettii]
MFVLSSVLLNYFQICIIRLKGGDTLNIDKFIDDNWQEYSDDLENLFIKFAKLRPLNKTEKYLMEEFMKTNSKIQLSLVSKFLDERSK